MQAFSHYPAIQSIQDVLEQSPLLTSLSGIVVLCLIAVTANFIVRKILLRAIMRLVNMLRFGRGEDIKGQGVIGRLANIVPALIIINGIQLVPHLPDAVVAVIYNVASAFIILTIAMAISAAMNVVNTIYLRYPGAANRPIKGYIQVFRIALYLVTTILIIATLIDKSPLILLSGLGAMAAVLMLVFQDTLLSLVASVQISSSDMLRVGDWIEMPQLNADGDVIDIALHTVKVQNWDKTITTLPTKRLISEPFKNWRGMQESGGRRIKRSIFIDQNSIHFLTPEEKQHLYQFNLLRDYLDQKEEEISGWNQAMATEGPDSVNSRRLTNIGTFRAYIERYLQNHPGIHQDMLMLVRQLSPGETGLPIELYCFTNTIKWVEYEPIQADIFDHLYAILPEFGLHAFQNPSGRDFQNLQQA